MRRFTLCLLAGAALAWPLAASARDLPAAPAPAPDAPAPEAPPAVDDAGGDIIIVGKGQTRQVQQLSQADLAILAPGTSPLKAIAKLPNVNFQSADAFGAYEWSERVSIRSFNQNQIGFTLDGIPLGDGSYGNTNGLHISRAISPENVGRTEVSQGAGSIGTQATNNLGGTIEFFSSDPKPTFGLTLNGTYGSANTVRAFGRLDTGVLGENGPSAYVSYGFLDTDKWKGYGVQRQNQVNAKFIAPVGPVRLVGTFDFSDRRENDYQDLSLDMIKRLGLRNDNISNNFPLAVLIADTGANSGYTGAPKLNPAAGTVTPAPYANADDVYYDAAGLRQDYLASLGIETAKGATVHGELKGYYHSNHGQGIWFTPYVPSPSGVPISVRTTEYDIHRKGVFGSLGTKLAFNDITVGGWYEVNDFRQARRFYGLDSRTTPTRDALHFQYLPFATQWYNTYETDTVQYYVQDKIALGDLTVDLGWKGFSVTNKATPIVSGGLASGRIQVKDFFQPHAGLNYKLGNQVELFGDFTEVTRAFVAAATSGPFATTQAGFNALLTTNKLKPETSDTYEVGARYHHSGINASVAGYYIDFQNRTLAQTVGAGIVGNPPILSNVGSVRAYGIETALEAKIGYGFGVYASYSYNDSTYRDNVTVGGVVQNIRGKQTVDTPKHLAKAELTYDKGMFFGRVGADYMSRRYFTYTNDQSVPDRVLVDATIGARVTIGDRKFEIQGNATNLFDKKYISTIGSNGFGYSGDNQTLLAGAPAQYFVTIKAGF
ncbi:MAG: TonB-dependent receptor [Pseudomonadota bacterium]